jgi:amino acid transporter
MKDTIAWIREALLADLWPVLETFFLFLVMLFLIFDGGTGRGGKAFLIIFFFGLVDYLFGNLRDDHRQRDRTFRILHHWITIPIATVIFLWSIYSLWSLYSSAFWALPIFPEQLSIELASSVIILVYMPVRGIRGLYRHGQNNKG